MHQKILIIEDRESVAYALKAYLEREGFQTLTATTGQDGLRAVTEQDPDLVILDLILPDMDGLEICRTLRRNPEVAQVPIMILSGRAEEMDKVMGLTLGADDYMGKPFNDKELIARVKALLRRAATSTESKILRAGTIELDPERYTVSVAGHPITLTSREYELLKALLEAKCRVLTRGYFLETVWGLDRALSIETRTVDVHIKSLRRKLGSEGNRIVTVRNVGYRCDVLEPGQMPGSLS